MKFFLRILILMSCGAAPILANPAAQAGTAERPRLVVIKVDGLSGLLLEAVLDPAGADVLGIPEPRLFQEAYLRAATIYGRQVLLPNIQTFFGRQGVRPAAIYSGTLGISAASWGMIDTGQPSIVKGHYYFNRTNGELRDYLDAVSDVLTSTLHGSGKTNAVWELDIAGVPMLMDAFDPDRTWTSLQIYYRQDPVEQLSQVGRFLLSGGSSGGGLLGLVRRHLTELMQSPDYAVRNDEAVAHLAREKVLEKDPEGREKYDFISVFLPSLDHQLHVDSDYGKFFSTLIRIDAWIGQIMSAVQESQRRESTLVALMSDHGLDTHPVQLNYSFPIDLWMRQPEFGGHTVRSGRAENTAQALTVPVPGMDFSRTYESAYSPYGPSVDHGEGGYYTAFTENAGNPRFDAHLRNSDLNRIHLLLLEIRRLRGDSRRLERIHPVFAANMDRLRSWLDREISAMQAASQAFARLSETVYAADDGYSADVRARLRREILGYGRSVQALERLLAIPVDTEGWLRFAQSRFDIDDLIPKGYLGPPNDLEALREYVAGWVEPEAVRWAETPATFRTIDYPRLFVEFRATNPNARGDDKPFLFFAVSAPPERLDIRMDIVDAEALRQAVWLRFSGDGGEALLLEDKRGRISYQPVRSLIVEDGRYRVELVEGDDDQSPFADRTGQTGQWWTPHEWAARAADGDLVGLPVIVADLFRKNYEAALGQWRAHGPESAGEGTVDVPSALQYHLAQETPDFRVWMSPGWNVNMESPIPGGTHGGFTAMENRTVFGVWGGAAYDLRRGEQAPGGYWTLDIAPTLLHLLGMLNGDKTVRAESELRFPFMPFPGEIIPLLREPQGQ